MMKVDDFLEKLEYAANVKTIYIQGCFGAPMNEKNKKRYSANPLNYGRVAKINAASSDTFGFDCVNLIKGILALWDGSKGLTYGGAKVNKEVGGISFGPDRVPDVSADGLVKHLKSVSTDFSDIQRGEVVWMSGHVGVYVGEGKVIECSPKWTNNVQYSNLGNLGYKAGNWRTWKKHGFLPWVDYTDGKAIREPEQAGTSEQYYMVVKDDTLSGIGRKSGVEWKSIAALNGIKPPYIIKVGQRIRIR